MKVLIVSDILLLVVLATQTQGFLLDTFTSLMGNLPSLTSSGGSQSSATESPEALAEKSPLYAVMASNHSASAGDNSPSTGSNPLSSLMGGNPLSSLTGSNPLSSLTGSNPLSSLTGSNPLSSLTGSNPLSSFMGNLPSLTSGNSQKSCLTSMDCSSLTCSGGLTVKCLYHVPLTTLHKTCCCAKTFLFYCDSSTSPQAKSAVTATTLTEKPTDPPSQSSSTPPAVMCHQCGDLNGERPCSSVEFSNPYAQPKSCPIGKSYCMTDVYRKNGIVTLYKRCVAEQTCANDWLAQTSHNDVCFNLDQVSTTSNFECHFCCKGDGCNTGIIPPNNATLYKG